MVQVISACLLVLGVTCFGLAEESQSRGNSPSNVAQTGDETGAPSDAPLIEAFHPKFDLQRKDERVRARAYLSVDKLPAGSTCQIIVVLNVEKGWHINAKQRKPDVVIPVKMRCKSNNKVELIDVEYPPGKPFRFDGAAADVLVHDGEVQFRGTLQIPKEAGGLTEVMEITINYQACNELGCLPPKDIKLIGKPPIAKHGEIVKPINGKLFNTKIDPSP